MVYAAVGGVMAASSNLVITYPAKKALNADPPRTQGHIEQIFWVICNFLLTGVSTGLSIMAAGSGNVAVVIPIQVGMTLLSNMILQNLLGIAKLY